MKRPMVRGQRHTHPRRLPSTAHSPSPIPAFSRTASTRTSNQVTSIFHRSTATPLNKTRARWLRPRPSSRSRLCSSVPTTLSRPASRTWAANCRQNSLVNSRCTVASFRTRFASLPSTTRVDSQSKSRACIVRLPGWGGTVEARPRLPRPTTTARSTCACRQVALCGRTTPRCLTSSLRRPTCSQEPPPSTSARSPTPGAKTTQTWSPSRS